MKKTAEQWIKSKAICTVLAILFIFTLLPGRMSEVSAEENMDEITASELYARSAVLMDADSGRILFAKNGQEERAMASTTKIMTCILALEKGNLSDKVTVSDNAAAQPRVHLGMQSGQAFKLEDLLYSLMLESHNDSAVAIAEHIGGSVEGFASMMNQKAMGLKCTDTYFITPNGLDAEDKTGKHHTTAVDLARIMKYCIMDSEKSEQFLKITRAESHEFSDCEGSGSYSCRNHDLFLQMMEGALSGKTGFTAEAGYCYVGALRQEDRTFIVALLACGWPNNKGYKWSDTRRLMEYGLENFHYRVIGAEPEKVTVKVEGGTDGEFPDMDPAELDLTVGTEAFSILLKDSEEVSIDYRIPDSVAAPVKEGEVLGEIVYSLNGETLQKFPVTASASVEKRTFRTCLFYICDSLMMRL